MPVRILEELQVVVGPCQSLFLVSVNVLQQKSLWVSTAPLAHWEYSEPSVGIELVEGGWHLFLPGNILRCKTSCTRSG